MKSKLLLLFAFALFAVSSSWAQVIEITPTYGYQFGSKLNYGNNYIKAEGGGMFGLTLGVEADDDMMVELSYLHHTSDLVIRDIIISPIESRLTDLNADWVFIGVNRYFGDDKIKPFFGGGLGVVFFSHENVNHDLINYNLENNSKFSFTFKGGVNIMFTDVVGLNIQGGLMVPVTWGGVYVGTGGSGASISGTTVFGYASGGLVFRLGE